MLDSFLSWFDFTLGSQTYNLLKTPWQLFTDNISAIQKAISSSTYSNSPSSYQYITENITGMVFLTIAFVIFIVFVTWCFVKIFSSIARSFTGWMRLK